jgi:methyl-accepting chemotaxis protein
MGIRVKFTMLMLGSFLLILGGLFFYNVLQRPIRVLETEASELRLMVDSVSALQAEANSLLSSPLEPQLARYRESVKAHNDVFAKVKGITAIPAINPETRKSFEAILSLHDIYLEHVLRIDYFTEDALLAYSQLDGVPKGGSLADLINVQLTARDPRSVIQFRYDLSKIRQGIRGLNDSLRSAKKNIDIQIGSIDAEIARVARASAIVATGVFLAIAIFALGLLVYISNLMVKSILDVGHRMHVMADGDLTVTVETKSKDEIGELAESMNHLSDRVSSAVTDIKKSARENDTSARKLLDVVHDSTSASNEINANVGMINEQMNRMDSLADVSLSSTKEMAANIASLHDRLGKQTDQVNNSSAAVTQILASIDNISRITRQDSESATDLRKDAEKGSEIIQDAFLRFDEIGQSVGQIREMVSIIQSISSQTNLLAMNAAIEAAHAGDAGRGFSVVADEIRKLAELAATSSLEIANKTAVIIDTISGASDVKSVTQQILTTIIAKIQTVADSIEEIYGNMIEMKTGSSQALQSMEELRTESGMILEDSQAIRTHVDRVESNMESLSNVSHEAATGTNEISIGLRSIAEAFSEISQLAETVRDIGASLNGSVDYFKLK